jgi:hypothetical protein
MTPEEERIEGDRTGLREQIMQELARFHRNSCYPEAMDFELSAAADRILALLQRKPETSSIELQRKRQAS